MRTDLTSRIASLLLVVFFLGNDVAASAFALHRGLKPYTGLSHSSEVLPTEELTRDIEAQSIPSHSTNQGRASLSEFQFSAEEERVIFYAQASAQPQLARDEIFSFNLPSLPSTKGGVKLSYQVKIDHSEESITLGKSFNGKAVFGLNKIESAGQWQLVEEFIPAEALEEGANYLRFELLERNSGLEIKNAQLRYVAEQTAQIASLGPVYLARLESEDAAFFQALPRSEQGLYYKLRGVEMPSLPTGLINITRGSLGYQPSEAMAQEATQLGIGLNLKTLPSGFSLQDVQVYYFDYPQKSWLTLAIDSMDHNGEIAFVPNKGSTQYFGALIKSPEMPEANAFAPTMMSDLEAANPASGMSLINPPSISQTGEASISYPLALPKGRAGMQANVAINYNSEGGSSVAGYGWSVPMQMIGIDTRWGTPSFDATKQSEVYTMNGEALIEQGGHKANRDVSLRQNGPVQFFTKTRSSYQKLERLNNSPSRYLWVLTDANNTKYYYGTADGSNMANDAVLTDDNGNIIRWYLKRVVDVWGNYVEYTYQKTGPHSTTDGFNLVQQGAYSIVLDRIDYTGHLSGKTPKYRVKFNYTSRRPDARLNLKEGQKILDHQRLDKIEVLIKQNSVYSAFRDWRFHYQSGPQTLYTSQLVKIEEYREGQFFYDHDFEYYTPMIGYGTDYEDIEFEDPRMSVLDEMGEDLTSYRGTVRKEIPGAPISGSSSNGARLNLTPGGGYDPEPTPKMDKNSTFSISIFGNYTDTKGNAALRDLNGDGLPDFLVRNADGDRYYPLRRKSNGRYAFDAPLDFDLDVHDESYRYSLDLGLDFIAYWNLQALKFSLGAGFNLNQAWSETSRYMLDYNNDGLQDLVYQNGDRSFLKFGYYDNYRRLKFSPHSDLTLNPIVTGATPPASATTDWPLELELVRSWIAPFDGSIIITGDASIESSVAGSMKVAIQLNDNFLNPNVKFLDVTPGASVALTYNLNVSAGDTLFFRTRAGDNGFEDVLNWDPQVQYTNMGPKVDPNGIDYAQSGPLSSFLLSAAQGVSISGSDEVQIMGSSSPCQLSDDALLRMIVEVSDEASNQQSTYYFDKVLNAGQNSSFATGNLSPQSFTLSGQNFFNDFASFANSISGIAPDHELNISFQVFSSSNVDWQAINWRPVVRFKTPGCDGSWNGSQDVYPTVSYQSFNRLDRFKEPINLSLAAGREYRPWLTLKSSFNALNAFLPVEQNLSYTLHKQAYISLKAGGQTIAKAMLRVDNAGNYAFHRIDAKGESLEILQASSSSGSFTAAQVGGNPLYLEVFVDDPIFADYLENEISAFQILDLNNRNSPIYSGAEYSLYHRENSLLFDQIAHWGVFGYNQKEETEALNPAHIKLMVQDIIDNPDNDYTQTANQPTQERDFQAMLNEIPDPDNMHYLSIVPRRGEYRDRTRDYIFNLAQDHAELDAWVINSTHCGYYAGGWVAAGKFLEPDRRIQTADPSPTGTDIAYGVPRKSKSKSLAGSFTLSAGPPKTKTNTGPNASFAPSKMINGSLFYNNPISQMIDLNGDGYPDLLDGENGIKVYFTNPLGGLVSNQGQLMSPVINGKSVTNTPAAVNVGLGQQINQDKRFLLTEPPTAGTSTSLTETKEYVGWQDLNGDGLQDLFESSNGSSYSVRLNNGFSLEPAFALNGFDAPKTESISTAINANLEALRYSLDKLSGSFSMGVNIVNAGSISERFYLDLTGDGLPEEIVVTENPGGLGYNWSVNVNTGTNFQGFAAHGIAAQFYAPNKSENYGFTVNGNLSGSFKLFGNKVNVTGGGAYNFSANNVMNSFIDVNGDGLPDFVQSLENGSESKVRVYFNQNGRALKLKQVINPLKGSFEISYALEGAKTGVHDAQVKIVKGAGNDKVLWDMPSAKWVLSQLIIKDGYDIKHTSTSSVDLDGVDQTQINFVYDGGVFNRREKAFMGFSRIETRSPQQHFEVEAADFNPPNPAHRMIPESGRVHKYYAEVQVFVPFHKREFQHYVAQEYKKGVLKDHYYFLHYDISYEATNATGAYLGAFSVSNRQLISHKHNDMAFYYVDHSDLGAKLGRIKKDANGDFVPVNWTNINETSVVFPSITWMETVVNQEMDSSFVFQNTAAPSTYFMQATKYELEYDDYFNVTRYTLGNASSTVTPAQVQVGSIDHYYIEYLKEEPLIIDFMKNRNLANFRTSLISGGLGSHYCYEVVPHDPSYQTQNICLADYWDPDLDCGSSLGDIYTIPVYLSREVHEQIPIYEEVYNLNYTGNLIAEMRYFEPSLAGGKVGLLKEHKIFESSTANPPKRHSKVSGLHTGAFVPIKIENVLVGAGQTAQVDIAYDGYGNPTQVTGPLDANGQRATVSYAYDTHLNQFPVSITNQFGESTCMSYDYRYGAPVLVIGLNGHPMQYQYDKFGRIQYIWAPREYYRGGLPTIKYEYFPYETVPVAITTHNISVDRSAINPVAPICGQPKNFGLREPLNFQESIQTATFVDGLGRTVQVKKESSAEANGQFERKREVSGFTVMNNLGQASKTSVSELEDLQNNIKTLYTFLSEVDQSAKYDLLGRVIEAKSAGGTVSTSINYFKTDGSQGEPSEMLGIETIVDYIKTVQVLDARGQKQTELRYRNALDVERTDFMYNPLGELLSYTSPAGVQVSYTYDAFGRVLTENHPDRGLSTNTYDLAGNLIKAENPATGPTGVQYDYQKGRLMEVTYPVSDGINGLKYTYGVPGDGSNGVGRVIKIEQGNGFKQDDYKYDFMGNLIYEKKRINAPLFGDQEYLTEFSYDSWGRILAMVYPDGEEVQYHYNPAGDLSSITGHRAQIATYDIVTQIIYNGYGQKRQIKYGNGTLTSFDYDEPKSRRLEGVQLSVKTPNRTNVNLLDKEFSYNRAGSIASISNKAPAVSVSGGGKLGGLYELSNIQYDGMNQVSSLEQRFGQTSLGSSHDIMMSMTYNSAGRLATKSLADAARPSLDYVYSYAYGSSNNNNTAISQTPNTNSTNHRLEQLSAANGDLYEFNYDDLGNITQQVLTDANDQVLKTEQYCWHENATLKGWSNGDESGGGMAAHYVYDHSGERILKTIALGGLATVNNRGEVIMAMESPTIYVNPYYIAVPYQQTQMVSKHYYMGAQRIASSVTDLAPQHISAISNGERAGEYAQPNYSSASDAVIVDFGQTMSCLYPNAGSFAFNAMLQMPEIDEVAFMECEDHTLTDPVQLALTDPECACEQSTYWARMYGANCKQENVIYWFHPDYLGSIEAVTDARGEVYQFFHNTIWGEPLQNQRAVLYNSFTSPYRFNGKERDWETGNFYYGARYYDPQISVWLGVDMLASKYPSYSPYNFVMNNPLNLIDPNGDSVLTSQEGYDIIAEGLEATLGSFHPFGFDSKKGVMTFDQNFDRSQYSNDELEVIDRMADVVTNSKNTNVTVVNRDQKIAELGNNSLADAGLNGGTSPDGSKVWLARNPRKAGQVPNPSYVNNTDPKKQFRRTIPGWVDAPVLRGVSALHEIGGHVNLRFMQPGLSQSQHNNNVERFETMFRQFYQVGEYSWGSALFKRGASKGDPIFLGGSAAPH